MRKRYRYYETLNKPTHTSGKLISWVQRKCTICKKYLSKDQVLFCSKCKKEDYKEKIFIKRQVEQYDISSLNISLNRKLRDNLRGNM